MRKNPCVRLKSILFLIRQNPQGTEAVKAIKRQRRAEQCSALRRRMKSKIVRPAILIYAGRMFDSLSTKLQSAFKNLRGLGKISESNIGDALREVRMALLEADVNFKVARDFIERVKVKSLGAEVISTVQPGPQIIKIVSDELTDLLGSQNAALKLDGNPSCLLMVGLHGAGKTTSSGKLAKLLKKQGRSPLLVAADVYRPAAMDQLKTLAKQIEVPIFIKRGETDVLKIEIGRAHV